MVISRAQSTLICHLDCRVFTPTANSDTPMQFVTMPVVCLEVETKQQITLDEFVTVIHDKDATDVHLDVGTQVVLTR